MSVLFNIITRASLARRHVAAWKRNAYITTYSNRALVLRSVAKTRTVYRRRTRKTRCNDVSDESFVLRAPNERAITPLIRRIKSEHNSKVFLLAAAQFSAFYVVGQRESHEDARRVAKQPKREKHFMRRFCAAKYHVYTSDRVVYRYAIRK